MHEGPDEWKHEAAREIPPGGFLGTLLGSISSADGHEVSIGDLWGGLLWLSVDSEEDLRVPGWWVPPPDLWAENLGDAW